LPLAADSFAGNGGSVVQCHEHFPSEQKIARSIRFAVFGLKKPPAEKRSTSAS
jgi:hypothetical protein